MWAQIAPILEVWNEARESSGASVFFFLIVFVSQQLISAYGNEPQLGIILENDVNVNMVGPSALYQIVVGQNNLRLAVSTTSRC